MNKNRKLINALLVSTMMLSGLALDVSAAEATAVDRIGGKDRVETSVNVSNRAYADKADAVVVAGWEGQPDALTGTLLASAKDAPLLLVSNKDDDIASVRAEIERLGAKTLYILGDTNVVTQKAEDALGTGLTVKRVKGDDRFDTAVAVAKEVGSKTGHAFITVDGRSGELADALAAGPASGKNNSPILLTSKNSLPAQTKQALKDLNISSVTIVGGTSAVSTAVQTAIEAEVSTVNRVNGDDRWETAEEVAKTYFAEADKAIITNDGRVSYADALVGGYFGALNDAPILLTQAGKLNAATTNFLGGRAMSAFVLGKEGVVSTAVKDAVGAIVDKNIEDAKPKELAVESVSAINTKNLEVTFNRAVEDTSKAKFEIKKGISTVGLAEETWNDDKTVATLELNTKITEGTYDVTVTGVAEEALTGSVKAENEKVTEINFLSDSLIVTKAATANDAGEAVTGYQLLNQYGEDVTANSAFRSKVKYTSSNGTAEGDKDGKLTVKTVAGTKVDDKVVVTAIDSANAVTANKTFTVVDEAKVSEVTLGEIYNKDGKELNEDTKSDDFYILLDVKDQYGNIITDETKLQGSDSEVMILSSNEVVISVPLVDEVTIKDKKHLALKLVANKEGDSLITVISKANGTSDSQKVTVGVGTKVDTVNIGTPEGMITGNKKIQIPVEITDNKGALVTKVADVKDTNFNVTQGNATLGKKLVEKDGQLFLELTTGTVAENKIENLLVTVQTPTNKFESKSYQVRADAVAKALVGLDSKISKSILKGQPLEIKQESFVVEDQYGNRMKDGYTVEVQNAGTNADGYVLSNAGGKVTITPQNDNDTKPSTTLEFKLVGVDSTIDVKFNMVTSEDFKNYIAKDIGLISVSSRATDTTATGDNYSKALKVYGVTASGQEVLLPKGDYNVIPGTVLGYDKDLNKVFVNKKQVELDGDLPVTKEGTLKVVINKTGQEIVVKGTASAEASKAAKVGLYVGGNSNNDAITNVQVANGTLNAASIASEMYIEDQYGVDVTAAQIGNAKLRFTDLKDVNPKGATITNNGRADAEITNFDSGDTVTVEITVGDVKTTVNATALNSSNLAEVKTNAKKELNNYAAAADYTINEAILTAAKNNGNTAIDAAVTVTTVNDALQAAINAIDGIDSDAEIVATATEATAGITAVNAEGSNVTVSVTEADVAPADAKAGLTSIKAVASTDAFDTAAIAQAITDANTDADVGTTMSSDSSLATNVTVTTAQVETHNILVLLLDSNHKVIGYEVIAATPAP